MRLLIFLAAMAFAVAQPEPVIVDTDCAIFNDDGAALAMVLQAPDQVTVLGVTLVPGNYWPSEGAGYMFRVIDALQQPGIPLHFGARVPLVHTREMAEQEKKQWGPIGYMGAFAADQPEPKPKIEHRASHKNAVDYLTDTILSEPGPVTILELGPMTNLAIALRLHPEIAAKIKRLIFMGGAVHARGSDGRAAEFNFWFDPEAASIVLRSAIPQKIMFGLDICNRAPLDKSHYDQIVEKKTPITTLYREDIGKRFKKNPEAKFLVWDCLAAAYLVDPSWVTKKETDYLDVQTAFGKDYGDVIPLDRALSPGATPVEVMLDLDFQKFFEIYKNLLTK
ncbi:MAG TPA: nucleoside hydrolase [Bryobacteraceae bacterium]|nr:nucleoside hydrolase [Bryobacteraceae bacterium]